MAERIIRLLSLEDAKSVYHRDVTRDFPPDERKPWPTIERLMRADRYVCQGLYEDADLRGYGFFAALPAEDGGWDYLLDYFAVLPGERNRGLGAAFLSPMLACLPNASSVIGEAENPDHAENEADRSLRERRMRFYLRCGVRDTGVTACVWGVEYRLLLFAGHALSPDAIRRLYEAFYRSFFPPAIYAQQVRID